MHICFPKKAGSKSYLCLNAYNLTKICVIPNCFINKASPTFSLGC